MRRLDTFDYALVAAVAALAYFQLPWRPAIRRSVRSGAALIVAFVTGVDVATALVLFGLLAIGLVVYLVEVLPGRH
ncbi:hypothetical protein ACFQE1_10540 [Halobium palmae]|uniref:Uncharacterized protein n=1 Tax=Halobium palmae TaxID=1776492 RepID=A0ABD5RZE7_9EURY